MTDMAGIKIKIADMAKLALSMWQATFSAFMEHDRSMIARVLEDEAKLNEMEKEISRELVALGRASSSADKVRIGLYIDIVGDLELMGDYYKDILERIEIKIEEKLLFSEEGVQEYIQLYRKTEEAMKEVSKALDKDEPKAVKDVIKKEEHIDSLVDEIRRRHNQRMLDGVCSPIASNMFLNMLDFTAAVYYHTKKIARNLLKLK